MAIKATDSLISISTSYRLRETTHANTKKTNKKHSPFKSSRNVLSPTKTASMWRDEGHDCSQLETQNTVIKVSARFFFSMFRFSMSHAWECKTTRGRTHYNGAQSHCGHCQAAHAALSPTLYDDNLTSIIINVKNVGYQNLTKGSQDYLKRRFALQENDQEQLSSENEEERLKYIQSIVSRLTSRELMGSFIDTPIDMARNTTFDNPTASNRIDCHLEHHLRSLEDELAEACRNGTKTPKEALQALQSKYQELLKDLELKLSNDQLNLTSLSKCWKGLIKSQEEFLSLSESKEEETQETFKSYLQLAEEYLKAYGLRFDNTHGGVPQLKELQEYLNHNQSPYILRTLVKNYKKTKGLLNAIFFFNFNLKKLKIPSDLETPFQQAQSEIERRKLETTIQLSVVGKKFEEINDLMRSSFGEKDSTGKLLTPTKAQLAERFNRSLVPVTPTRSDRQRKRVSKQQEIENPLSPLKPSARKKLKFVGDKKNIPPLEKMDLSLADSSSDPSSKIGSEGTK